jgi:NitT/TauT family transport system permease protein
MKKILIPLIKYSGSLLIVGSSLVLYQIATDITHVLDPILFPGLPKIAAAFVRSIPQLLEGLKSSLGLLIPSYSLALITGISGGIIIGLSPLLRKNLIPIIHALSPIPPILYIPYSITIFST